LNSDIEVTENWLHPLVSFMDNNPDVASCQPKILSYYQKDHFEHAGAAGCFIDKYGYPFCRGRIINKIEKDTGQYDNQINVFWSSGACMIVRSEAWKKCGGFDADFFAHMEEIDLCWRFHKTGYRVCFLPDSVIYHVGGGTLPYTSPFKTYLNFRNSLFLLYKNLPDNKLHTILFIRRIMDGLAVIYFLMQGSFKSVRAVWNAHMDYYKAIDALREKRKAVGKLETDNTLDSVLNKSIVFEFYIKGNKTYNSLIS
jgi:GT2 family glycosyltransferase